MYQKSEKNQSIIVYNKNGMVEDFQDIQEIIKIQKRHFKKGEFYMQTFSLDNLILEKNYSMPEIKTLIALKKRLDFNNRIKGFRQTEIAIEIKSSQPNVSKALKRLERDKIIRKDGVDWYFTEIYIKGAGDKSN